MPDDPAATGAASREEIRARVQEWASRTSQTQADLARKCGVGAAELSHFLHGQRALTKSALANLAIELRMEVARLLLEGGREQCTVELEKIGRRAGERHGEAKTSGWERARDAYDTLLARLPRTGHRPMPQGRLGTLVDWPHAFLPLVVFVGDRRESPPVSPADLLAASASMGDVFYLPRLNLPPETEIRSDKTAIEATEEGLRSLLGDKNLLIIGSPAANLVAREANQGACFSSSVRSEAAEQEEAFKEVIKPYRYLPGELERFADINSTTQEHQNWSRRRRHMIYGFARSGILDPVDYEGFRANATPAHADYGIVTLCRHPWSENRIAVMAAGLHGPGTAAAVKLLSTVGAFRDHPLGGVFRVHVPINAPWEQRFAHLAPQWDTHGYTVESYERAVGTFLSRSEDELSGKFRFWNPAGVMQLIELLNSTE